MNPLEKNLKKYLSDVPKNIKALYESNSHWAEIKLFEYWKASGVVTEMVNQIKPKILHIFDCKNIKFSSFTFNISEDRKFSVLIEVEFVSNNEPFDIYFTEGFEEENLISDDVDVNEYYIGALKIKLSPIETIPDDKILTFYLHHELMHAFQCYMIRAAHNFNKRINKKTRKNLVGGDSYNKTKIYYEMLNLRNKSNNSAIIGLLFNLFHKTLSSEIAAAKQEFNIELNYITEDQTLEDVQVFKDFISIPLKQIEIARNIFQEDFDLIQYPFRVQTDKTLKGFIKEYEVIWHIGNDYTWKDHLNLIESKIKENEIKFRESFLMNKFNLEQQKLI